MTMANNPLADALGGGVNRRRKPGEAAGGHSRIAPPRAMERRIAVDVPSGLYTEAKVLAAELDTTVKQIMVAGLRAEVERLQERGD